MKVVDLLNKLLDMGALDGSMSEKEVFAYDPEFGNYVAITGVEEDVSEGVFLTCEISAEEDEIVS